MNIKKLNVAKLVLAVAAVAANTISPALADNHWGGNMSHGSGFGHRMMNMSFGHNMNVSFGHGTRMNFGHRGHNGMMSGMMHGSFGNGFNNNGFHHNRFGQNGFGGFHNHNHDDNGFDNASDKGNDEVENEDEENVVEGNNIEDLRQQIANIQKR